jgi:hypothetical protein
VVGGEGLGISENQLDLLDQRQDEGAYPRKSCEAIYYSSRNYSHDLISASYIYVHVVRKRGTYE